LCGDADAVNHLVHPEPILENGTFKIEIFLNRMRNNKKFSSMTDKDVDNFYKLLNDEAGNRADGLMTVEQLQAFLVRFGPLLQSIERIRSFVNDGAAKWYHGNISKEIAETLLYNFLRTQRCQTCYLIRRASPIQNGQYLPDTVYVFAASYLRSTDSTPLHTRLYVNKQYQLCIPVREDMYRDTTWAPVHMPNFIQFLKSIQLEESEYCKPVPSDVFRSLTFSENIGVPVKVCSVDEKKDENGYIAHICDTSLN